jgi:hypothetical protein
MTQSCAFCGHPAEHRHHVTGRAAPGERYFDDRFCLALCGSCHAREHAVLRRLGLGFPVGSNHRAHRILRFADVCIRFADADRGLVLDAPSTRALGMMLLGVVGALDCGHEGAA